MKKIYAFLAGVTLASGVSAATLEKAPRLSMENATVVGRIETKVQKKVADRSKVVLSRAEEEAPVVTGDYMMSFSEYNTNRGKSTYVAPSNNLVATETEGEYLFESFIFDDISMKANLHYDPEFWVDEYNNPVGEWVLSVPVGPEASEPLFYEDLSQFSGFTNNEPIYFYLVGLDDTGQVNYYNNDSYEFVVRDGFLMAPYNDGFGVAMASGPNSAGRLVVFASAYLDFFTVIPNAHGTAIESAVDSNGQVVSNEVEFPMYTEPVEVEGMPCLYIIGLCGWPGDQIFILDQEEKYAYTFEMPLTVLQNYELYMTQDAETTEVFMDITPETTGNTVLSTDFIGLIDASDVSGGLWATYENVVLTLDYNVWSGEAGIKAPAVDTSDAPAVFYNLQGMEISNPTAGQVYIVKQGSKVSKQIIK